MSNTAENVRLISPQRRRIYPNPQTGAHLHAAGSLVATQREGLAVGQPDAITWEALKRLGWTEYRGPSTTDERGYIIPGSDLGVGR